MVIRQTPQPSHVCDVATNVYRYDCSCSTRYRRFNLPNINCWLQWTNIHDYRNCREKQYRICGRRKRIGGHDNLVPIANANATESRVQSDGAVCGCHTVFLSHVARKCNLKFADLIGVTTPIA
jgi:hypothetical protein